MFRKLTIMMVAVALAATAFAALSPAASAQEEDERGRDARFLRGRGVLHAEGDGLVAVKGHIDLQVSADRGILLVKDIAGDARIDVEGEGGTAQFHGFTAYFGTGEAHINGSHVAVIVIGEDIDLDVVGKGWAYLKGEGTFTVNGRGPFRWTPDGTFAGVVSDASQ
jgi:hypothetical protein